MYTVYNCNEACKQEIPNWSSANNIGLIMGELFWFKFVCKMEHRNITFEDIIKYKVG